MEKNQKELDQKEPEKNHRELVLSRGIYLLPNILTIGSLFAGFYAIVSAFKGSYEFAAISIFVAMLLDGLDGRVARMTNTMSSFGAELDSLTDMVSFGVAPALVIYCWSLTNLGKLGWLAAFIYAVAVALRLARFNTQIGKGDKKYFQGLSCTASAGVIAGVIWVGQDLTLAPRALSIILALLTVTLGALMVSNIRYRSFKDIDFKNHVPFVVILFIVLAIVLISIDPAEALFAIFFLYALSGPIETIWGLRQRRKLRRQLLMKKPQQFEEKTK